MALDETLNPRATWARRLLWLAAVAPFIYSTSRAASDITSGGLGVPDIVRGGGPFALVFVARLLSKPTQRGHGAAELALGAFCAVALASAFWSVDPRSSLFKAIALLGAYLAIVQLVRAYASSEAALNGLATAIHLLLIAVAVQFLVAPHVVYAAQSQFDPTPRLGSLVPQVSANPLAYAAVGGLAALLMRLGPGWIQRHFLLRVLLGSVYTLELVGTRTRSGIVVGLLLLVLAFVALIGRRPNLVINTSLLGLLAVLWLWPTHSGTVHEYFIRGQNRQGLTTLTGRTNVWDMALAAWDQEKLLGLGYFAGHRLGIPGLPATQSNLDNTWIEALVDVGLLGTVALGAFALAGLWRLVRSPIRREPKRWALLLALYGLAVSLVNPTIQGPGPAMLCLAFPLLAAGVTTRSADEAVGGLAEVDAVEADQSVNQAVPSLKRRTLAH